MSNVFDGFDGSLETLKGELRKKNGLESLEKLVDLSLETSGKLVFQMI